MKMNTTKIISDYFNSLKSVNTFIIIIKQKDTQ